jgi:hypothetical protein
MRTERAWPVSEVMGWAIGVATHCTKIGVSNDLYHCLFSIGGSIWLVVWNHGIL